MSHVGIIDLIIATSKSKARRQGSRTALIAKCPQWNEREANTGGPYPILGAIKLGEKKDINFTSNISPLR